MQQSEEFIAGWVIHSLITRRTMLREKEKVCCVCLCCELMTLSLCLCCFSLYKNQMMMLPTTQKHIRGNKTKDQNTLIEKENARATTRTRYHRDATWHGWSGKVVLGFNSNSNNINSLSPAMSECNPVL